MRCPSVSWISSEKMGHFPPKKAETLAIYIRIWFTSPVLIFVCVCVLVGPNQSLEMNWILWKVLWLSFCPELSKRSWKWKYIETQRLGGLKSCIEYAPGVAWVVELQGREKERKCVRVCVCVCVCVCEIERDRIQENGERETQLELFGWFDCWLNYFWNVKKEMNSIGELWYRRAGKMLRKNTGRSLTVVFIWLLFI